MEAVLERFFSSVFSFRRIKSYCWWRHTFSKLCVWNPVSELLQICHKLEKRQLRHSFGHGDIIKISLRCFDSLATFSFWSKFHVNTVTGSGVMTISFYEGLTRNLEMGNILVWVLPNIWRLGRVTDTKFGRNVSNKMLLNVIKCHGYSFSRFWVIKGKSAVKGWGGPGEHFKWMAWHFYIINRKFPW